ncbi:hypothetical protein [Cellulomonas sp. NS3]|uniref:hypothetical protein n=1 Tax=Cellulomonas sp. NS3 TaxID=2973977 RepID=UPI002163E5C2|nr:hypothetical protein [Cellulomonas sp. NS3]
MRLGRGGLLGGAVGLGVFALLTGSLAESEVASFEARPELAELFAGGGGDLARAAVSAFLSFFAMARRRARRRLGCTTCGVRRPTAARPASWRAA